jgi:hypothetical protein
LKADRKWPAVVSAMRMTQSGHEAFRNFVRTVAG